MSGLGHFCDRYLWLSFRWTYEEEIPQRLRRLFKRGHREEKHIIEELERVGIRCWGDQIELIDSTGHVKGHNDGIGIGFPEAPKTEHLLEFKTMACKKFEGLVKKGVRESFPKYFVQMQLYMRMLKLTRAMFIAVNKNNDEYHTERVRLDKGLADDYLLRGGLIVRAEIPETRKYKSSYYECKFCAARHICSGDQEPLKNCRTCEFSLPVEKGQWACKFNVNQFGLVLIDVERQRIGCPQYTLRNLRCQK
jgi:hypothetical protein